MDNNEKDLVGYDYSILERQLRIQQQDTMDTMTEVFATFGSGSPSNRPMSLKRLQAMMEEGGVFFSTEMSRSDMEKRLGLHDHNEDGSCPLCDAGVPTKKKVLAAHEGNMISFDTETIEPCPIMSDTFEGLEPGKMFVIDSIPRIGNNRIIRDELAHARQLGMTQAYAELIRHKTPKGEQKPLRFNKKGKIMR